MAKSALNNTVLYGIGSLVKACASFFLLPLYTSILGAEQYGQLSVLQTASVIISTCITLALERSLYRLYHDYKSNEEKTQFLSTLFVAINIIGFGVIMLFALLGRYLTIYLGGVDFLTGLFPVVLYSYTNALINYCQIILQTRQEGGKYLFVSLLFVALYNVMCIAFLYFYSPTYHSMVFATLITTILVFPISFSLVKEQIKFFFSSRIMKEVLSFSTPILGMIIFAWILNFSDRLFLANMTNLEDVGLYSFAAKIVSVVHLICGAIFQSYVPYFYNITNNYSFDEAKKRLIPVNDTILFTIVLLSLLLTSFYTFVLHAFFSTQYYGSTDFFYFLITGAMIGQNTGLLNNMLLQNKKSGKLSIITISAGVLSLVLNLLLISYIGRIGAAISHLIATIFIVVSTFLIARREYYIPFNFKLLLMGLLSISTMFVIDVIVPNVMVQLLIKLSIFIIYVIVVCKSHYFDSIILERLYCKAINKVKYWK